MSLADVPTKAGETDLPPDRAEPDPAYREVLAWVWSLSSGQRSAQRQQELRQTKLARVRALLARLGDPHRRFASVLVAGTKGKGSTVAMIAAALQAAGVATGRYTSPHLVNWRERAAVAGAPIRPEEVVALAPEVRAAVASLPSELGQANTFEVGTLFAFLHFARRGVAAAVVEVGVGGRFDATNVLDPLVSVVTPISLDHTQTLGPTLGEIAWHKAGVLRPGRVGVVGPQPPEALRALEAEAAKVGARLERVGRDWSWEPVGDADFLVHGQQDGPSLRLRIPLLGDHQRDNATAAVAALRALGRERPDLAAAPAAIQAGLGHVDWPGRLQVLRRAPWLVVDGAQNAGSAAVLRRAIEAGFTHRRLWLVLGVSAGKDVDGIVRALGPLASRVVATRSAHERAEQPESLAAAVRRATPAAWVEVAPTLGAALDRSLREAGPDDLVLVTGSLFLVGEALVWHRAQ
jgi:dihydrofolate synthase / folylpolyglutamate synthase